MGFVTEETEVMNEAGLSTREKNVFFPTYERLPIGTVVRAEGAYIYTEDGQKYLDAIAGLGVNALGHSDPEIVSAIKSQAEKYLHLSNLYLQESQVLLAEQLSALSGWDKVFFTNSGTEATEGAVKLARKYFSSSEKNELVGIANGFHGRTYAALSVMDKEKYRTGYGPFLADTKIADLSETEALESIVSERTAAVILEVIQGEGGIVEISDAAVKALMSLKEKYHFLIIADEIQSGIGRTGTFFAYEQYGLKPDIVICAKAIGGGLPLGAILTRNEIASAMKPGSHGTTFGGNALACAAGKMVLDRIQNGLLADVKRNSEYLIAGLHKLQGLYPSFIKEIRGKGFMLGIELMSGAKEVVASLLKDHHIVANLTTENVIRLLPPLIFTPIECDQLLFALGEVFGSLTKD
jgi:predicted acetylornithine/succinylornithine family transaminase